MDRWRLKRMAFVNPFLSSKSVTEYRARKAVGKSSSKSVTLTLEYLIALEKNVREYHNGVLAQLNIARALNKVKMPGELNEERRLLILKKTNTFPKLITTHQKNEIILRKILDTERKLTQLMNGLKHFNLIVRESGKVARVSTNTVKGVMRARTMQ